MTTPSENTVAEDYSPEEPAQGRRISQATTPHFHVDEHGFLVRCYHRAKTNYVGFIVGTTLSFPLEHFLYEKVPPFSWITQWLGL